MQNSKSESRNPKQIRNANLKCYKHIILISADRHFGYVIIWIYLEFRHLDFGFILRFWSFKIVSDFDTRVSDLHHQQRERKLIEITIDLKKKGVL